MVEAEQLVVGMDDLPVPLLVHILARLPLVERARCGLVCRRWKGLLREPSFWAELSFEGCLRSVDDAILAGLIRRAQGRLRSLDVSAQPCDYLALCAPCSREPLLTALAAEGLTGALETLATWRPGRWAHRRDPLESEAAAAALAAACPRLTHASVDVSGDLSDVSAILRRLPAAGGKRVHIKSLSPASPDVGGGGDAATTAASVVRALCALLTSSHIDDLEIRDSALERLLKPALPPTLEAEAAAERLSSQLVALLASPAHGPSSLRASDSGLGATPAFGGLCRALTDASPLRRLVLCGAKVDGAGATALAALLGPGRSRLETLDLSYNDLSGQFGCVRREEA